MSEKFITDSFNNIIYSLEKREEKEQQ